MQLVSTVWSQEIHGFPMFSLYQKLKSLKVELKKFNEDQFGGLSVRVQKARDDLERRLLLCPGHSILLQLRKRKTIALCLWVMLRKVSWSQNPGIIGSTWEIRTLSYSIGLLKSDQMFVWWPRKQTWESYSVEGNGNWVLSDHCLRVKDDVLKAVGSFFTSSKLLSEVNSTLITLVPKSSWSFKDGWI